MGTAELPEKLVKIGRAHFGAILEKIWLTSKMWRDAVGNQMLKILSTAFVAEAMGKNNKRGQHKLGTMYPRAWRSYST